jgi:hypothetical protein
LHSAQVLQLAIRESPGGSGELLPENEFVREHASAIRNSKIETAAVLGAMALGAYLAVPRLPSRDRHARNDEMSERDLAA